MISSEVQRTLVKSPPELWAEISDPESLARHLGEFGEIRITRVQPEQRVEWETDDASGTVVIKPSGWGTKVKLTVTRELAEIDAQTPSVLSDNFAEPAHDSEREPDQAPLAGQGLALEADHAVEQSSAQTHAGGVEPAVQTALQELALTETELELGAGEDEDEPASELYAGELDGEALDPEPIEETLALAPEPIEEFEPEPRRGFFARLFGRRRARSQTASAPMLVETEPQELEDELRADAGATPEDDLDLDLDPDLDVDLENSPGSEPAQELVASSSLEPVAETTEEDPAENVGTPIEDQGLATVESASVTEQPAEPDDVSARAKLAEELAAEEVTAVLTGVLDRLGAAHHRPFSRA